MKTLSLTLVLSLIAIGTAGAVALPSAAPAEASTADGGVVEYVQCNVNAALAALKGRPSLYCYLDESEASSAAAGPDPKAVAACVGYFVQQTINGNPIEPCAVGATFEAGDSEFVDCVKSQVRQILAGVTPMPCAFPAESADAQLDPKKVVDCTRYVVGQIVTGRPVLPCEVSFDAAAAAGPDVGAVVDCTKKAVRDIVQGTPQPCPI